MAIEILQYPASCSLAQSPIVCAVSESISGSIASSSFQYIAELYYWTGSVNDSGSLPQFTLAKYPNTSLSGIFDFSKIINSTLEEPIAQNSSNVIYYKGDFYHQYISASAFVTSSHVETGTYKAIDGYALYQEPITQSISDKSPYWPMMTDGPATQSAYDTNKGQMGVFVGDIGDDIATRVVYSGSNATINVVTIPNSTATSGQIGNFPIGIGEASFPLTGDLESYTVQAGTNSTLLGSPIKFEVICEKKYPNVRLKWKNRFGQFDFHNFNLVSREAFRTRIKTFQRQIGSWTQPTLSYENYDSATQNKTIQQILLKHFQ